MTFNSSSASLWVQIPYITIEAFIGLFAIVGNVLVIWVVKLNPSLQTTTFYFIVSLAIADIAVGLLVIPLAIVISMGTFTHFYSCLFMCCVLLIFTHASIMSLLAIAVDRYLRVKLTVRYRRVTTQRRIWLALGLSWLLSFLVGLVPMFGWNKKTNQEDVLSVIQCSFLSVMSMEYMVYFSFFTWIFIPLVVMCAIYLDIFYTIRNKLSQNFSGSKETGIFYGREFKTAKSLFLVLFLFALCWLPLSVINCAIYFEVDVPDHVMFLGILLSHANSVMNPIVYACKIKKFKETYFLILRECRTCQQSDSLDPSIEQTSGIKTAAAACAQIELLNLPQLCSGKLSRSLGSAAHTAAAHVLQISGTHVTNSWHVHSSCTPGGSCSAPVAMKRHFLPVMQLFILLALALFSDAMVMDEKIKESAELDTTSVICNYDAYYKDHTKYWCRGYFRDYCSIIAITPNSTDHVVLRDTGDQLIVTLSCLTKKDTGWYWCGIQRNFARDDMDFTELIVTEKRQAPSSDVWSKKDPSNKNSSCRASKVFFNADISRMSILIICMLMTGLGIIFIISHLSRNRRSQRNRRGDLGTVQVGHVDKATPFSGLPKTTLPGAQL
ncbi:adenosine receptor A3 [Ctenodactylus gundi]